MFALAERHAKDVLGDEVVYRRVPVKTNWYAPAEDYLSAAAFRPTRNDLSGISLSRAKFLKGPADAAALGYQEEEYWIVELRVRDLLDAGASVVSDDETDPSHAIVSDLRYETLKTGIADELMDKLRRLPRTVHGPLRGHRPKPTK